MNELKIIKGPIPESIKFSEISYVITEFYKDAKLTVDFKGFMARTLEMFSSATFMNNGNWDLWICESNGIIRAYFLCSVEKAVDNNLCYMVHQGWISKEYRGNGDHRGWWNQVKERAKQMFCKQMLISSVRNYEAYKRWLGEQDLTVHSELLHLKLED